jgi:hypothetical protein
VAGRRLKIKYVTQTRPPGFVVSCSRPHAMPQSYVRYLSNSLREVFDMPGVSIPSPCAPRKIRSPASEKTPLSAVSSSSHVLQLSCLAFSGLSSFGRDRVWLAAAYWALIAWPEHGRKSA